MVPETLQLEPGARSASPVTKVQGKSRTIRTSHLGRNAYDA